jgi:hypothetical protein
MSKSKVKQTEGKYVDGVSLTFEPPGAFAGVK